MTGLKWAPFDIDIHEKLIASMSLTDRCALEESILKWRLEKQMQLAIFTY